MPGVGFPLLPFWKIIIFTKSIDVRILMRTDLFSSSISFILVKKEIPQLFSKILMNIITQKQVILTLGAAWGHNLHVERCISNKSALMYLTLNKSDWHFRTLSKNLGVIDTFSTCLLISFQEWNWNFFVKSTYLFCIQRLSLFYMAWVKNDLKALYGFSSPKNLKKQSRISWFP